MGDDKIIPAVSFKAAHTGVSTKSEELGMRRIASSEMLPAMAGRKR